MLANQPDERIVSYVKMLDVQKVLTTYIGRKDSNVEIIINSDKNSLPDGQAHYTVGSKEHADITLRPSIEFENVGRVSGKLNDTGITKGRNLDGTDSATCESDILFEQDCHQGRDSVFKETDNGFAGFNFTKLDHNGKTLSATATSWTCVRDNVTGLVWEVKTDDGGIHDKDDVYRWGGLTRQGDNYGYYYNDWSTLINESNNSKYCGLNNWRIPTIGEFLSLVTFEKTDPSIDTNYFPNTKPVAYWSGSPSSLSESYSWYLYFKTGTFGINSIRYNKAPVRLVHITP